MRFGEGSREIGTHMNFLLGNNVHTKTPFLVHVQKTYTQNRVFLCMFTCTKYIHVQMNVYTKTPFLIHVPKTCTQNRVFLYTSLPNPSTPKSGNLSTLERVKALWNEKFRNLRISMTVTYLFKLERNPSHTLERGKLGFVWN
jgi:hypothetical protein